MTHAAALRFVTALLARLVAMPDCPTKRVTAALIRSRTAREACKEGK